MCAHISIVKEWLIVEIDNVDEEVILNFGRLETYCANWSGQWRIAEHTIIVLQIRSYTVTLLVSPLSSFFEKKLQLYCRRITELHM